MRGQKYIKKRCKIYRKHCIIYVNSEKLKVNSKRFLGIVFFVFFLGFWTFADPVTLNITTADGHLVPFEIDDETTILNISNFTPPFNKYEVDSISGLEQLKNLEVVQFIGLNTIVNFSFLTDAPNLKEVYISSCIVSSLKFIENLTKAELIFLDVYVVEDDYDSIKNTEIDMSQLENLIKLSFSAAIIPAEEYIGFGAVPKFSYVPSHPDLVLGNNDIEHFSEEDIEILSQFNNIYLWPNPILNNQEEMENLEGLNIITR